MSSANSSFSSYGGDPEEQAMNEKWLDGTDKQSDKSSTKNEVVNFDDKYEFLDHKILGEVRNS